ncbi:MAG: YdeI/OmpD-associated family protein [Bacteroidota bacterium]
MNKSVDHYLTAGCGRCPLGGTTDCKVHRWTAELEYLRQIVNACGLTEECKWGVPCYTFQGNNVLIVSAFNEYCSISFFKGALLADGRQLLIKPGPNSQAARLFRFKNLYEIQQIEETVKSYIFEAISIEEAGLSVPFKKNPEPIPAELELRFEKDPVFKAAFEALTPGRQRGYIIHFSQPKQEKTRISRIEKCTQMILSGIGLNDKYRPGRRQK